MQNVANPRFRKIEKVSRFFKYLSVVLLTFHLCFAVILWFLPSDFEKVEVGTTTETDKINFKAYAKTTIQPGPEVATASSPPNALTINWKVGLTPQPNEDAAIERIKPDYVWLVKPFAFIRILFLAGGIAILYRLFSLFERGILFEQSTVQCIKWLGVWILGSWCLANLFEFIDIFINNPAIADFRFDMFLAAGILVLLISWIMEEGHKIQEEQSLTI